MTVGLSMSQYDAIATSVFNVMLTLYFDVTSRSHSDVSVWVQIQPKYDHNPTSEYNHKPTSSQRCVPAGVFI